MINIKTISFACDHAGYDTKEYLKEYLKSKGYKVLDFGTNSNESVDYRGNGSYWVDGKSQICSRGP